VPGLTPTASAFRMRTGASIAYGFTEGGYNAEKVALTDLGRRAVAPIEEGDDLRTMREGFLRPRTINEFLIFSADEELFDKDQNPVWKNSENVGHELGAAAVMYDDRIIIFKEESVSLASNYESIGYIEFEKDKLDAKLADLLTELVALKILRVQVGE
jgi:hypothetical protein